MKFHRITKEGMEDIGREITAHSRYDATPEAIAAYASDIEESLDNGNGAYWEIRGSASKSGNPVSLELSAKGFEVIEAHE